MWRRVGWVFGVFALIVFASHGFWGGAQATDDGSVIWPHEADDGSAVWPSDGFVPMYIHECYEGGTEAFWWSCCDSIVCHPLLGCWKETWCCYYTNGTLLWCGRR